MHTLPCSQPFPEIDSFQFFEWLHKPESGPALARKLLRFCVLYTPAFPMKPPLRKARGGLQRAMLFSAPSINGMLCLLLSMQCLMAQASVPLEYRSKARFLATFPNFIDWPPNSFSSPDAPVLVCVFGDFQFGTSLAEFTRNTAPHGRRVEVRWVHKGQELRSCHILFISHSESKRYAKVLQFVQGADVLTVGEAPDFLEAGGAMSFSFQNDALQFEVNLLATTDAHLRVSSRLLALARHVVSSKTEAAKG
jgi:YfiR/HmsC-like